MAALRLRYRLMPYLWSSAVEAARTGAPMMRALLVDTPEDPAAWRTDLEYRLGTDLLVAPMTNPDGRREVYLPAGDDWVDTVTGDTHHGGRYLRIDVPLDRVPLFVRHGALLPVGPPAETAADGPFTDVTLVSWGGTTGQTVVHDVDGDTVVEAVRDGDTLRVGTSGPLRLRGVALAPVAGADAPARVLLNGEPVIPVDLGNLFGVRD
ncbi:hypothetical protein V6U90_23135 [Micromonospora sp. CPCC 206060]|uniref:hypothetical protein n=1 Tax=Micromonospora sp. CPCC 206060 TaxID=3122406 RepID=UPI002FEEAF78